MNRKILRRRKIIKGKNTFWKKKRKNEIIQKRRNSFTCKKKKRENKKKKKKENNFASSRKALYMYTQHREHPSWSSKVYSIPPGWPECDFCRIGGARRARPARHQHKLRSLYSPAFLFFFVFFLFFLMYLRRREKGRAHSVGGGVGGRRIYTEHRLTPLLPVCWTPKPCKCRTHFHCVLYYIHLI